MEIVGVLLFIGVLIYLSSYLNNRDNKPVLSDDDAPLQSSKQILSGHIKDNLDWLAPRWELAEKLKQDGDLTNFGDWYYKAITDKQSDHLCERTGIRFDDISRGEASDLIGLFRNPDEDNLLILKFFKINCKGKSQTWVRNEVMRLFLDESNKDRWENRPATPIQKEFYVYLETPVPRGLTYTQADLFYGEAMAQWDDEAEPDRWVYWDTFESIWEDMCDREFRQDVEIKKPSVKKCRAVFDELAGSSKDVSMIDSYDVAERLVEVE